MFHNQLNTTTRIVVLGAGFGGVYAFKRLHKHFHKRRDVELLMISDSNFFLFTPLLHEVASGNIDPAIAVEPLRKILGCASASCNPGLHIGKVRHINTAEQQVETDTGSVSYDHLITALGSVPHFANVEGAEENSFTLKSMSDAIQIKNHIIGSVEYASSLLLANGKDSDPALRAYVDELLHIVIVGGGPTGVELAAELADLCYYTFSYYYPKELIERLTVTLIQRKGELMGQFDPVIRKKSLDTLRAKNIRVLLGTSVTKVTKRSLTLENGKDLPTRSVIWTAGVQPAPLSFDRVLARERGKIVVDEYLRIPGISNVYAIGDIAYHKQDVKSDPTPALAQAATKQGEYLGDQLARIIDGRRARQPFHFDKEGMLVSLGKWRAAGEVKGVRLYGRFTWWLWRTIYLSKIISWSKKAKVAVDWTLNAFARRDISQISACPDREET